MPDRSMKSTDHIPSQIAFWVMIIAIVFINTSCAQMRYKIAKRHLDKIGLEVCDTITIHDTTTITQSSVDTVLKVNTTHSDTVIIREGQSEVKYFYSTKDSTIFIEGKCHDTTVVIERVGQTKVVEVERDINIPWMLLGTVIGALLAWCIFRLFSWITGN
jgi:hypothetical protein